MMKYLMSVVSMVLAMFFAVAAALPAQAADLSTSYDFCRTFQPITALDWQMYQAKCGAPTKPVSTKLYQCPALEPPYGTDAYWKYIEHRCGEGHHHDTPPSEPPKTPPPPPPPPVEEPCPPPPPPPCDDESSKPDHPWDKGGKDYGDHDKKDHKWDKGDKDHESDDKKWHKGDDSNQDHKKWNRDKGDDSEDESGWDKPNRGGHEWQKNDRNDWGDNSDEDDSDHKSWKKGDHSWNDD